MYNDFLKGHIAIKDMNPLEFTQLITEWKQDLFRIGFTNINDFVRNVLKSHLKEVTNETEKKIIINYLRSE